MKPKIFLPLLSLAISAICFGQVPAEPTSRSDEVAKSIYDRIAKEVSIRSGNPNDPEAIGRNPMRVVFLVDTSQATDKDYFPPFVAKVAAGVLRRIGGAQLAAKMSDDALDDVWFYPYQLDLIQDAEHVVTGQRLKKGGGTVQKIVDAIPAKRLPIPGEGNRGHDSSKSRRTLIDLLGRASAERETVIIQVTTMPANSDPDHPENHAKITGIDARSGLLEGTDYMVYQDDGRYYQTDSPGGGVSAADVHVWLYGPAKFEVPPPSADQTTTTGSTTGGTTGTTGGGEQPKPINPVVFVILVPIGAAVGYLAYRFFAKFEVSLGDERRKVGTTSPIAIVTVGHKGGNQTVQISAQKLGQLSKGVIVGQISVPFFAGGPRIKGDGGHQLYVNSAQVTELQLGRKESQVAFGKGDLRSDLVKVAKK